MEELKKMFDYWNNRGKSAICRYILKILNITLKEFTEYTESWKERKLIYNETLEQYEIIIEPIHKW